MDKVATHGEMNDPGKKSIDLMDRIVESMEFDETNVNDFFSIGKIIFMED